MKRIYTMNLQYLAYSMAYFALLNIPFSLAMEMEPKIKPSSPYEITLTIINNSSQDYTVSNSAINQIIPKKTTQSIPLKSLLYNPKLYLQLTTTNPNNPQSNGIFLTMRSMKNNEKIFSASLLQGDLTAKDAELSFNTALDKPDITVTVHLEDNYASLALKSSYELSVLETQNYKLKKLPYALGISVNNNTYNDYTTFFKEGSQQVDMLWLKPHTTVKRNLNEYLKSTRSNTLENTLYIEEVAHNNNPKKLALHVLNKISRTSEGLFITLHILLDTNFGNSLIEKSFSFPIIPRVSEWNIDCQITNDPENPLQIKLISQITQKELV